MFNELKRMYHYQVYYLFDNICEIIKSIIFITGILFILKTEKIEIFYFFVIYVSLTALLSNNSELEYEIRTNQYESLNTNEVGIYRIYSNRLIVNFIFNTLVFILGVIVYLLFSDLQIYMPISDYYIIRYFVIFILNMILVYLCNVIIIKLTINYKRISLMLGFFNYIFLFLSGMIFPVKFFTYRCLLDIIADIIAYKLTNL